MVRTMLEDGTSKTFYGKRRQKEVSRTLAAALRDRDAALPIVGEKQPVGQYLRQWLNNIMSTIRPRSWVGHEEAVRLHMLPTLGHVLLVRLSPQQVQALYTAKLTAKCGKVRLPDGELLGPACSQAQFACPTICRFALGRRRAVRVLFKGS